MHDASHHCALTQYKLRACAHVSIQLHLRGPLMLLLTVRSPVFRAASTKSTRPRLVRTMVKARSALEEMGSKGEFVRKDSVWRDTIKEGSRFAPEGAPGWQRLGKGRPCGVALSAALARKREIPASCCDVNSGRRTCALECDLEQSLCH